MLVHPALCGVLMANHLGMPRDEQGCCRPEGHEGPHLSNTSAGPMEWEVDLTCDCEHCQRCEGDYCEIYWPWTQVDPAKPDATPG